MRKFILATLVAATVLTPVVSQAADVAPANARTSLQNDNTSFQRDEGRRGEGRRGDGEGRRGEGRDLGVEYRGPQAQEPQPQQQAPQAEVHQRNWSQERNSENRGHGDGQRGEYRRQARPEAQQDGRYYDRNRDGNLDRRWDRNRDGNLDRNYDRNRDGRLDRRLDRNDDERIDRRYDRNNDNRVDRSYQGQRGGQWSNNWRNDRRYDWRGHRDRYRSYYSPGRYYSPYRNHGYSRIRIGLSLGSGYYGSRYWINDPWYYRLPSAYGSYRWVRYYDDVLLVDLRSGRVVDVIYDFFW